MRTILYLFYNYYNTKKGNCKYFSEKNCTKYSGNLQEILVKACILGVSIDHIWDFDGLRSIQHSESEVTDTLTRQASFSAQHINVSVT